jgi:uncharacterized membrane-anchored protein YjiN (DUF445 family)
MIHIQVVSRDRENLQTLIRAAIAEGSIKSFEVSRVKGGLTIRHKKHIGEIRLSKTTGPLLATIICKNRAKEFALLETFVGRLAYHFKNEISGINIQLEPAE